jgi:hypothetical protein
MDDEGGVDTRVRGRTVLVEGFAPQSPCSLSDLVPVCGREGLHELPLPQFGVVVNLACRADLVVGVVGGEVVITTESGLHGLLEGLKGGEALHLDGVRRVSRYSNREAIFFQMRMSAYPFITLSSPRLGLTIKKGLFLGHLFDIRP